MSAERESFNLLMLEEGEWLLQDAKCTMYEFVGWDGDDDEDIIEEIELGELTKFRFAHMPAPPRALVDVASDAQRLAWRSPRKFRIPARPAPSIAEDIAAKPADGAAPAPALLVLQFPHTPVAPLADTLSQLHATAAAAAQEGSGAERERLAPFIRQRHGGAFDRALLGGVTETPLIPPSAPWLVHRVEPLVTCPGRLMLTDAALYFQPAALNNLSHRLGASSVGGGVLRWPLRSITAALRRRRLMREVGLEVRAQAETPATATRHASRSSRGARRRRTPAKGAAALSDSSSDSESTPAAALASAGSRDTADGDAGGGAAALVAARHAEVLATGGLISHARAGGVTSDATVAAAVAGSSSSGGSGGGAAGGGGSTAPLAGGAGASAANHVLLSFASPSQRDEAYALLHAAMRHAARWVQGGATTRPTARRKGGQVGSRRARARGAALDSDSSTDSDASGVGSLPRNGATGPLPSLGDGSVPLPPARSHGRVDEEVLREVQGAFVAWRAGALSNYEYLCVLNSAADRSPLDLTQYPVFPWVLDKYNTEHLDLSDPRLFRDLSKPIGALNPERLESFLERFREMPREEGMDPPFMYGTHYSTPAYVLFFLVRAAPQHQLKLQAGKFDAPDRQFHSVASAWAGVTGNGADLKELTPEFYDTSFSAGSANWSARGALQSALPSGVSGVSWVERGGSGAGEADPFFAVHPAAWLRNSNGVPLGRRMDGDPVEHVQLPPWARGDPGAFVLGMRAALESDHVSAHMHQWIDLIFGVKQQGVEAEHAANVFHPITYEGFVDLERVKDATRRHALQLQIAEFGQTPRQLFTRAHPQRTGPPLSKQMSPPSASNTGVTGGTGWGASGLAASFAAALGIQSPVAGAAPANAGPAEGSSQQEHKTSRAPSTPFQTAETVSAKAAPADTVSSSAHQDAPTPPSAGPAGVAQPPHAPHPAEPSADTAGAALQEAPAAESGAQPARSDAPLLAATSLAALAARLAGAEWRCACPAAAQGATCDVVHDEAVHVPSAIQNTPPALAAGACVQTPAPSAGSAAAAGRPVLFESAEGGGAGGGAYTLQVMEDATVLLHSGAEHSSAVCLPRRQGVVAVCCDPEHGVVFLGDVHGSVHSVWCGSHADQAGAAPQHLASFAAHPVPVTGLSLLRVAGHAVALASCSAAGEVCVWSLTGARVQLGSGDASVPVCVPGSSAALFEALVRAGDVPRSGGGKPKTVASAGGGSFRPLAAMSTAVSCPEGAPVPMACTALRLAPEGYACDFAPPLRVAAAHVLEAVGCQAGEAAQPPPAPPCTVGVWGETNGSVVWFNACTGQPLVAQDVLASRWGGGLPGFDWGGSADSEAVPGVPCVPPAGQGIADIAFVRGGGQEAAPAAGVPAQEWFVAAGTRDGAVAVFDSSAELRCLVQMGAPVSTLAAVRGAGHLLAVGCDDGGVRLLSVPAAAEHGSELIAQREAAEAAGDADPDALWLPQVLLSAAGVATLLPPADGGKAAPEGSQPTPHGQAAQARPVALCRTDLRRTSAGAEHSVFLAEPADGSSSTGAGDPAEAALSDVHVPLPRRSGAVGAVVTLSARAVHGAGCEKLSVHVGHADGATAVWSAAVPLGTE